MKKSLYIIISALGLSVFLWILKQKQPEPLKPEAEPHATGSSPARSAQSTSEEHLLQSQTEIDKNNEAWVKDHSAGLVIAQEFDSESNEPRGTVTAGHLTIDLGETPPVYRHELQTSGCPIMLGEKHQRRSYEIYVTSIFMGPDGITKKHPLHITYPRWPGAGLETSGGFVFMKNETPLAIIGVILPKVNPSEGLSSEAGLLEWQINIRMNDKLSDVDTRTKAKLQSLDSDVVVLTPTHPDNIPASSPVVWFKFEKDGAVSLLED